MDINRGHDYVFLTNDATEVMRKNKRKVRYVFVDEQQPDDAEIVGPSSRGSGGYLVIDH